MIILFACVQTQYIGNFTVGDLAPKRRGHYSMNIAPNSVFSHATEIATAQAGFERLPHGDVSKFASGSRSLGSAGELMSSVKASKQLVNKSNPLGSFVIPTLNLLSCGEVDEDGKKITGDGQRHVSASRVAELVVRLVAVA